MAKCYQCDAETSLYNKGVPICTKCDDNLEQQAHAGLAPPKKPAMESAIKPSKSA